MASLIMLEEFEEKIQTNKHMGQHVTEPTHVAGHMLDLVIARQDTTIDRVRFAAPLARRLHAAC